jgi:hypothetical protein
MLWKVEDNNQMVFRIDPTRMNISKPGDAAASEHLYPDFRLPVDMFKFADNNGMVLVYSITSRSSFDAVECFVDARKREKRSGEVEPKVLCLIGNKLDASRQSRRVLCIEGEKLAKKIGCAFVECSAKDQKGLDKVKNTTLKAMDAQRQELAKVVARRRISIQSQERGPLVRSHSQAEVIRKLSEAGMMQPDLIQRSNSSEETSSYRLPDQSTQPSPQPDWMQRTPQQHSGPQNYAHQPISPPNANQPSTIWKNAVASGPPLQIISMGKLSHYRPRGAINRSSASADRIEEEDEEEESTESTLESRSSSQQSSEPSVAPISPPANPSTGTSSSTLGSFFQYRPSLTRSSSRSSGTFVAERRVLTKEPPRSNSAPTVPQSSPKRINGSTRMNPAAIAAVNRSLASPDPELPSRNVDIEITPATPLTPLEVIIPQTILQIEPIPQTEPLQMPASPTDSVVSTSMLEKMDLDRERARLESEKKRLEDQMKLLEEQQRRLDEKRRLGEEMKLQQEKARKRRERKMLLERQEAEKRELEARQQKEMEEMKERQRQEALQYHDEEDNLVVQKIEQPKPSPVAEMMVQNEEKPKASPDAERVVQKVEKPKPSSVAERAEIPEVVPRHETVISEKGSRQTAVKLRQQKEIESLWDEVRPPPPPPRHALHHKKESPQPRQASDKVRLENDEVRSPSPRSPFHKMSFEREEAIRSPSLRASYIPEDAKSARLYPSSSISTVTQPKQPNLESSEASPERTTFNEETPISPIQPSESAKLPLPRQSSALGRGSLQSRPVSHTRSNSAGVIVPPSTTGNVATLSTLFASKATRKEKSEPKVTTMKSYGNEHGSGKENVTVRGTGDVKEVYGKDDKTWTNSRPRLPFPGKYVD